MTIRRTGSRLELTSEGTFARDSSSAGSSPQTNGQAVTDMGRRLLSGIGRTVEGEILPRLLLAFDAKLADPDVRSSQLEVRDNVEEFVSLVLTHEADIASQYVMALRDKGVSLPAIYLDLLAPAARRLGEMWDRDECSFTDVTIGLCRMHQVLLEFSRCFDATEHRAVSGRSALIVPGPGEQHTFGLFIVIEFFRRSGWNCWSGTPQTPDELSALVEERNFDVVGLSVSADRNLETTAADIGNIRRHLRNSDALVLAGGRPFADSPELAQQLGADATAADGRAAVKLVDKTLVKLKGSGN